MKITPINVVILAIFLPLSTPVLSLTASNTISIQSNIAIENNKISAHLVNERLDSVMQEVARQSGIEITFNDPNASQKTVTIDLQASPLEDGIKRILRENYVFSFMRGSDKVSHLRKITIGDKSLLKTRPGRAYTLSYGSNSNQLGAVRAGEGANVGPGSFFADANGRTYICDTVNKRIKIFSAEGQLISSLAFTGDSPEDIAVDDQGNIYVFDTEGSLHKYSASGEQRQQVDVDENQWSSRGPMHMVGNQIYARVNGEGDVLIASVEGGKLVANQNNYSSSGIDGVDPGMQAANGKRYSISVAPDHSGASIGVADNYSAAGGGQQTLNAFIPLAGVVSAEMLGEDKAGNFYAKTEGDRNGELVVEVSKFSNTGAYQGTIQIPGNDYALWSIRTLTVDDTGIVHQMMPTQDGVKIGSYSF